MCGIRISKIGSELANLLSVGSQEDEVLIEWSYAAIMAVSAGCRLNEAVQMPTSALKGGMLAYTASKNDKSLLVPIVIEEYKEALERVEGDYFCPNLLDRFNREGNSRMSNMFTNFVSDAGVSQSWHTFEKSNRTVAQKTFHSLRHTLRTLIVSGGGSDAQADLILGHSPGEGKRYTHAELGALKNALDNALND